MNAQHNELALRLQGVIDTAIDGIITISDRGIVDTMNNAAAKIFGYLPQEVIGKNIKMLMGKEYSSHHDGYIDNYLKTKKAKIIGIGREVTGMKKNGEFFPFRLAVSEVILHDRIIFTGIIHDLSEVKEAQESIIKLNEKLEKIVEERTSELEKTINQLLSTNRKLAEREYELKVALDKEMELNELKSRFVSTASHEFRTPLSTILSSASLILRYEDKETQEKRSKHVNRIKSAVVNLTGILNDFLSLSKIEEGQQKINATEFSLETLCNTVADEIKGLLKQGQSIQHKLDDSNAVIKTDKKILKNILFNLTSNALKYSNEGSVVKCDIWKEDDYYIFKIVDEGIGIPEAQQKHLFERFFRASNAENIQGTGLGLNIVKKYLELLKGNIYLESKENIGTTVTFTIPVNV